jgi:membrane protein required for beta-lactamase induction
LLAWIPARLTALGYALAGNFDGAIAAWRGHDSSDSDTPSEGNESLLARVGMAALALTARDDESVQERGVRGALAASGLVLRLLGIWAVVIAVMTLQGSSL